MLGLWSVILPLMKRGAGPLLAKADTAGDTPEALAARMDEFMTGGYRALVKMRDEGVIKAFGGKGNDQKKWEAKGDSKGYNASSDFQGEGAPYKKRKV